MTDHLIHRDDDFAAIQADADLLDVLAVAGTPAEIDPAAAMLLDWRAELDGALGAATTATIPLQRMPMLASLKSRSRKHTAGLVAAAVVLAASTGVAAAATTQVGPFGTLHRSLFGGGKHHDVGATVSAMLDRVGQQIDAAHAAGGISAADRSTLAHTLTVAQGMLPFGDTDLSSRLASLRAALAALPALPKPPARVDDSKGASGSGDGKHATVGTGAKQGSDDGNAGSHDRSGHDDGSGSGGGSDDGSTSGGGSDDGSTSGSGSGSGSGSDDGSTSGGGGGGSDDSGSRSGSGSDDGSTSGSGSGSGSGSDDSGSTSGGSDGGSDDGSTSGGGSGGSDDGSATDARAVATPVATHHVSSLASVSCRTKM